MGLLKRKTPEEKAAAKAEKNARSAALRAKLDAARAERQAASIDKLRATLAADETVEAVLQTAEAIMKKDVLFTSKRLLVSPVHNDDVESIPYRAITAFKSQNFITKDVVIHVQGRKESLELAFSEAADRDRALAILNSYAL